jgi:tRNA(Ile)-lysidine synthase TilS/MesJ
MAKGGYCPVKGYSRQKGLSVSPGIRRKITKALSVHGMIQEGDRILVGLSGGKDSLLLVSALKELQKSGPLKFDLAAATIDITGKGTGFERLSEFCRENDVDFDVLSYPILDIIRDRRERSPCSLCANLRNGILFGHAAEKGFDTVALGHNLDDAVETVLLNLFLAGRFKCFRPRSWRSRKSIWVIRPFVYLSEDAIAKETARLFLPVTKWKCPHDKNTQREEMKQLVASLEPRFPALKSQILHALIHFRKTDVWGLEEEAGPES